MFYNLGFLGAGNMVSAISKGIVASKLFNNNEIIASCTSDISGNRYKNFTDCQFTLSNIEVVKKSKILIIGVKPQVFYEVANEVKEVIENSLIISIVAGINISTLKKFFGNRVVRVMPNTPVMLSRGVTAFCCSKFINEKQKKIVNEIFNSVGIVREVQEDHFDLITALSGSGPAFIFKYMEEMVNAAVDLGLDRKLAFDLTLQTLSGSIEMVDRKLGTPQELREKVTSLKGTTYEGLKKMNELKFNRLIKETLIASKNRSAELGKEMEDGRKI